MTRHNTDFKVVDLFCGAGGMSLGFILAGFRVVHAFDSWKPAIETYRANLGDHAMLAQTDAWWLRRESPARPGFPIRGFRSNRRPSCTNGGRHRYAPELLGAVGIALLDGRQDAGDFAHRLQHTRLDVGRQKRELSVAVMFATTLAVSGYHRWQAAKSREKISRRDEGGLLFLAIRLSGAALFAATLAYLINPELMHWAAMPLPPAVRWSGAVVGATAIVLLFWTLNALGANLTDTVVTRRHHTLITTGPYRWIRHPFYVEVLLLVLACSLLNWFMTLVGVAVFALLAIRSAIEERKLAERFGDEYLAYRAQTRRFLPRVW